MTLSSSLSPLCLAALISSVLVLGNTRGFILWACQGAMVYFRVSGKAYAAQPGLFVLNGMPWLFRIST